MPLVNVDIRSIHIIFVLHMYLFSIFFFKFCINPLYQSVLRMQHLYLFIFLGSVYQKIWYLVIFMLNLLQKTKSWIIFKKCCGKKQKTKNLMTILFAFYILVIFIIWSLSFYNFILIFIFLNLLSFWSLLPSHLQRMSK